MALTWGQLRDQVRRSVIRDTVPDEDTGEYKWSDDELRDFCWWALDAFAAHTAVASATAYPADSLVYELPENLYSGEPLDVTGIVFIDKTDGTRDYLDPVRYTDLLQPFTGIGFYTRPDTTLHLVLSQSPGEGDVLHVQYYAYYNHPYADTDTIDVPRWAYVAIPYLIGAHALAGASLKSSVIRQWNSKKDSGNPEDNPIMQQQREFQRLYEAEIAKHPPQNRTNHFREAEII